VLCSTSSEGTNTNFLDFLLSSERKSPWPQSWIAASLHDGWKGSVNGHCRVVYTLGLGTHTSLLQRKVHGTRLTVIWTKTMCPILSPVVVGAQICRSRRRLLNQDHQWRRTSNIESSVEIRKRTTLPSLFPYPGPLENRTLEHLQLRTARPWALLGRTIRRSSARDHSCHHLKPPLAPLYHRQIQPPNLLFLHRTQLYSHKPLLQSSSTNRLLKSISNSLPTWQVESIEWTRPLTCHLIEPRTSHLSMSHTSQPREVSPKKWQKSAWDLVLHYYRGRHSYARVHNPSLHQ
jgi:hypothetical protein